ncbi:cardiolipin synthase B [Endozoicomonas sp. G2_2]|uniref:phospholipase D-like domain-containing protein n=1 Tax=Endozoicomonas sp. G2_2 TaxID=2821092 RepID=UPI001ADD091B|nr:phospholipase D-like domain-containing protein [Endozoicomonas sp. G2_2]MBO9468504.1 cardiolipin synthase B [Endozoicomonas sp. G2_2]
MTEPNTAGAPPELNAYRRAMEGTLGIPFTAGNRVERLVNGARIFPAMIDAIEAAEESIDFLTFIYWQGDVAERFGHILAERARAGVRVRILLDSFGAHSMPDSVLRDMETAGAEVAWFRPVKRWRFWQVDNRTHRKILVVDNRVGFTGGVGIAAEWDGDARNPDEWRETHFRLTGPAIDGLRGAFLSNWVEAGRRGFEDRWTMAEPLPDADRDGALIQVLRTSAAVNYSDIATLFRLVIKLAQKRLRITTGYFVPDTATVEMLCDAARRGVEIEVLMPGPHTDSRVARIAGEDAYGPLLEAGVKLYRYQPTMLHAKIVLVDDAVVVTGSANFNHRSMGKDDEIAISIIHEPTIAALGADFDTDRARCEQVTLQAWQERGAWQRFKEYIGRLLSPQA